MNVLVLTNMAPFVWGGAEELAHRLVIELNATAGIQAELLRVPFKWDPAERLIDEMIAARSFRLANVDRVIGLKFPAYLIPHPQKTIWLVHQYRQAYDLFETKFSNLPPGERGETIRHAIRQADDTCFRQAQDLFTIGRVPHARLLQFNRLESEVLPLPPNDMARFIGAEAGDYIFAGGRIDTGKRQALLIDAMRHVRSSARLIIGGAPANDETAGLLRDAVRRHDLEDRVTLDLTFLPREKLADYVNHALACAYVPIDEDAPGYFTMECFHAAKAVLTATDSGGVLDLVKDGHTGWVASPDPLAMADAIDRAFANPQLASRLGVEARDQLMSLDANWPNTIERLVS